MPFSATQIDLEIIILSEVNQRKTNTTWYHIHGKLKMIQMNLFIKQKQTHRLRNKHMVTEGERLKGGMN